MLPILIKFQGVEIYSYPLFLGISCSLAFFISSYLWEKKFKAPFVHTTFFLFVTLSFWIGAKFSFLLVTKTMGQLSETLPTYLSNTSFWLGGGLIFYGGLIAALITGGFFLWRKKISFEDINTMIPALPLAHGVGRIGCFLAGCCFGKIDPANTWFSPHIHGHARYPVQLVEALFLITTSFVMMKNEKAKRHSLFIYLMSYSLFRFFIEFLRGDDLRGIWWSLSTSQLVSLFLLGALGIVLVLRTFSPAQRGVAEAK